MGAEQVEVRRVAVIGALLTLYVIWGSTYLAIAILLETVPPFLSAGARFVLAGAILYAVARASGVPAPDRRHWAHAIPLGALFFLGGNGGVVWGETRVSSGLVALLVAMVPMWVAVIESIVLRRMPSTGRAVGLLVGMVGIGVLVGGPGDGAVDPIGALAVMGSSATWAAGTVLSRSARLPSSSALTSGMEMFAGGIWLALAGVIGGEVPVMAAAPIDVSTIVAFLWLLVGGSIVGFSAYQWLLTATTPAVASTYAYVNPVVAVILGWWWAGEPLGARELVAGGLIVSAVVLITTTAKPMPAPKASNAST